jgi:hypothetical protein
MYLTIETLIELTGYSKNTIYSHSPSLGITPKRGKIEGNSGKGLYTQADLDKLLEYKSLIEKGQTRLEAYEIIRGKYGTDKS